MMLYEGDKVCKKTDPSFVGIIVEKIWLTPRYAVKIGHMIHLIDAMDLERLPPVSVAT